MTCSHCYTSSDPKLNFDYFPLSKAKEFIVEAEEFGLQVVTLIGGEPLLHPHFEDIVEFIAGRPNITLELETNGLLLHKFSDILNDFPRKFAVEVSIDGKKTRGEKETELAFDALELPIVNANKCVQTLCSYENLHTDFYDICRRLNERNVDQVIYMGPSGCGRGKDLNYLSWVDCKTVINALSSKKWSNIRVELPPLITGKKAYGCGWNTYRLEILPTGEAATCVQAFYENKATMGLGNAFEVGLHSIWNESNKLNSLRMLKQSEMSGACKTCDYWVGCFGSCRSWAQSWDKEKRWTAPYHRCDEFLSDKSIDHNFSIPYKEIDLLKLPWTNGKYRRV